MKGKINNWLLGSCSDPLKHKEAVQDYELNKRTRKQKFITSPWAPCLDKFYIKKKTKKRTKKNLKKNNENQVKIHNLT